MRTLVFLAPLNFGFSGQSWRPIPRPAPNKSHGSSLQRHGTNFVTNYGPGRLWTNVLSWVDGGLFFG